MSPEPARGTPDLVDILRAVDGVEGWMTPGQGATLVESARRCPPGGTIVEIGSFRGRSTIVLALAADPSVEVIAIDPHAGNDRGPQEIAGFADEAADDHAAFTANLAEAGVSDRVRHLRMFSDDALDSVAGDVDLLYIDGAHRYAPARADIVAWGARVRDGGTMLIHDSFSSIGVTAAILRELVPGGSFRYVGRSRSMTIYRADLPSGWRSRAVNAGRQLAQLPWFATNVTLKLLLSLGFGKVLARLGRPVPEWPY
ncbi:MAG: class I SAM-dependent methyltransferase [Acidobacteriota bacterium]